MDKALKDQLHLFRLDASDGSRSKPNDVPLPFTTTSQQVQPTNFGGFSVQNMNMNPPPPVGLAFHQQLPNNMSPFQNSMFPGGTASYGQQLQGGDMTNAGILNPPGNVAVPHRAYFQTQNTVDTDERRKLELQRQQQKIRQSFQTKQNKAVNPDELLNKIASEFKAVPVKPTVSKLPAQPQILAASPATALPVTAITTASSLQAKPVSTSNTQIKTAKKPPEITELMNKFSDLSAPSAPINKFAQPAKTADIPKILPKMESFSESQSSRDWKHLPDNLTSAFNSASMSDSNSDGMQLDLPPWCHDPNSLPAEYHLILAYFRNQAALDKSSVIPFFNRSGLSNLTVEHVWKNVCRTQPGYLTRGELCAALALIGLAQSNFDVNHLTIDVLRRIPNPPVPQFISRSAQPQPVPAVFPTQLPQFSSPHFSSTAFQDISLTAHPVSTFQSSIVLPVTPTPEDEFDDFVSAPISEPHPLPPKIPPNMSTSESFFNGNNSMSLGNRTSLPVGTKLDPATLISESLFSGTSSISFGTKNPLPVTSEMGLGPSSSELDFNGINLMEYEKIAPLPVAESFAKVTPIIDQQKSVQNKSMPLGWAVTDKTTKQPETQKSELEDWSDWTKISVPSNSGKQANQPISVSSKVAESSSKPPVQPEVDRYSAFRDLFPVAPAEDNISHPKGDFEFSSLDPKEPTSKDESILSFKSTNGSKSNFDSPGIDNLSLNSLDLGNSLRLNLEGESTPKFLENRASPDNSVLDGDVPSEELDGMNTEAVFIRAVQTCTAMIREAVGVFNSIGDSKTLLTVIGKAKDYVQGVIEVYRVGKRLSLAARSYGLLHNSELLNALAEMEEIWADFLVFLSLSSMEPRPGTLDFSPCLFGVHKPDQESVCGLCLLNVDGKSKMKSGSIADGVKVDVAGRFYHVSCANLWLNLVSETLPRLNQNDDYM